MARIQIPCRPCSGRGGFEVPGQSPLEQPGWRKCTTCNGTCNEWVEPDRTCPRCNGNKKILAFGVTVTCGLCLGNGTVKR